MLNYWLMMFFAVTFASKQGYWHYSFIISFFRSTLLGLELPFGGAKRHAYGLLVGVVFLGNYMTGEIHFLLQKK
jgi:hypothetical protein